MNAGPPPLSSQPPPAIPPRKSSGCGGCLIAFVCLCAVVVLGAVALSLGCVYLVKTYTKDRAVDVPVSVPTAAETRSAQLTWQSLHQALSSHQRRRIELTGEDLNALIAGNADFGGLRGKARIGIADSEMTLQMALPLSVTNLPTLKDRWLNANIRLAFSYSDEGFQFDFKSADAQGLEIPESFVRAFSGAFSKSFDEKFREVRRERDTGNMVWDRIERIALEGDKLVIVTKGSP